MIISQVSYRTNGPLSSVTVQPGLFWTWSKTQLAQAHLEYDAKNLFLIVIIKLIQFMLDVESRTRRLKLYNSMYNKMFHEISL